jgi:hypothetical protein
MIFAFAVFQKTLLSDAFDDNFPAGIAATVAVMVNPFPYAVLSYTARGIVLCIKRWLAVRKKSATAPPQGFSPIPPHCRPF